jgi:hypothetical protein
MKLALYSYGVRTAGYWKNATWNGFSPLDSAKESAVYSLIVVQQ